MDPSASDFLIFNVHDSQFKPSTGNDSNEEHVWDSPWTTDQMRDHSHSWSLGGDSGLLNRLQDIAQSLISQTHLIQKEVNSLSHETEVTHAVLNNVNNDFLMLSNSQFVESRVYDEEVSNTDVSLDVEKKDSSQIKSKEEKEAEIISKVSRALKMGISVINVAYEHLQVQDSDSEDDGESYHHEPILHPKDPYLNRPLPYIIGSELFYSDSKLGIFENLSEDELPDDVSIASSKVSDGAHETNYPDHEKNGVLDDVESDIEINHGRRQQAGLIEDKNDSDIFNPVIDNEDKNSIGNNDDDDFLSSTLKNNFDKELASKMRNPQFENDMDSSSSSSATFKKSQEHSDVKTKVEKHSDRIHSGWPNTQHLKPSDNVSVKGYESDDDDDDDLFGKDGLFSSKRKTSDVHDNLFKSKTSIEDVNFKSKLEKSKESNRTPEDGREKSSKSGDRLGFHDDLFSDSDDDVNDLFATSSAKKPAKIRPLFDQKDVSSTPDLDSNKKKLPVGAKSMFGVGVNKLNQQIAQHIGNSEIENEESDNGGSQISRSTSSASIKDSKKEISTISASSSSTLFADNDDEDDLFGASANVNRPKGRPSASVFNDLVDDDLEDIFAPITSVKSAKLDEPAVNIKNESDKMSTNKSEISLYSDDDISDDLFFQVTPHKKPSGFEFSSEKRTPSLSDDSKKAPTKLENDIAQVRTPLTKTLFEEDDEGDFDYDLFKVESSKGIKPASKPELNEPKESKKKVLFDDDDEEDLLFGPSVSENPDVNLFGSVTKEVPKMKDEKKQAISIKNAEVNSSVPPANNDIKVTVNLEEKNEEEGVFVVSAEMDKTVRKPAVSKISKLRSDLENQLADNIGSKASPDVTRKKPIGGVSMLGGIVPNLLKSPRSPSPVEREESESASNSNLSEESSSPKSHIGSPLLSKGLAGTAKEVSVSFDGPPDETNILHNANKDRAKIQVKRRPQTRRARQETIRKSAIDIDGEKSDMLSVSDQKQSSASAPTSPISPGPNAKHLLPPIPVKSNKLSAGSGKDLSILSPSTDEEDLFVVDSRQPSIPRLDKGIKEPKANVSTAKRRSSSDNLFGDNSDEGESEELFKPKSARANTTSHKSGEVTLATNSSLKEDAPKEHSSDAKNSIKTVKLSNRNDAENDFFGELSKSDLASKAQSPASGVKGETNEGRNKKVTEPKHKISKSLFDDDDDDDALFKTNVSTSKAKPANASINRSTKTKSLFDDEDTDLFEDPLMAHKQ